MRYSITTTERCRLTLNKWREHLALSNMEKSEFKKELKNLDDQLIRLTTKTLQISVFGRVGVGKSSLLNAVLNKKVFATDITNGSTHQSQVEIWDQQIKNINSIEIIDNPGIDQIDSHKNNQPSRSYQQADLILFVLDSDLTNVELKSLEKLLRNGKPIILVLNRCDQWSPSEINEIKTSIIARLPDHAKNLQIKSTSAAPRQSHMLSNGKIRSEPIEPNIESLREVLLNILNQQGELFLALNSLHQADVFYNELKKARLKKNKASAQALIGKFAALKASSVAASPLLVLDLTTGIACDTALVMELSKLYGLHMGGTAARTLVKQLSIYNSFLGGAQLSIQFILGMLRHVFLVASPFTGGLSLAPAAPIALAQAALAVHTTKLTGRLVAKKFLRGTHRKIIQPRSMLRRIAKTDPQIKLLLAAWPSSIAASRSNKSLQTLLP